MTTTTPVTPSSAPSSTPSSAVTLLRRYASYHRDRRNIATHFFGVPLIVFALALLLARPAVGLAGFVLTPAALVFAALALWYLTRGHLGLGGATTLVVGALVLLAQQASGGSVTQWLAWAVACFVVGRTIQFVGHYYEGRSPPRADDLVGLAVGPMFITMEAFALLGLFKGLVQEVERHAGPTCMRDLAHPATR